MAEEKLTAMNYLDMSIKDLVVHPDYSPYALEVVGSFMNLTTEQLILVDLTHIKETSNDAQRLT